MCNSNQIRLWAVCPVIHKKVSRMDKIVRVSWGTAFDLFFGFFFVVVFDNTQFSAKGNSGLTSMFILMFRQQ